MLPALGESVTEGTVTRWLKQVGDVVEADEPLLEVSTDKVDTEIPAPAAGMLLEIVVGEDETAEVGAKLAVIGAAGCRSGRRPGSGRPGSGRRRPRRPAARPRRPAPAPAPAPAPPRRLRSPRPGAAAPAPAPAAPAPVTPAPARRREATDEGAYVTPLVRKLAAENGVDLGTVKGTGVGGRIRKQDVIAAAEAAKAAAARRRPPAAAAAGRAEGPRRWRPPRCAARPSRCPASARSSATTWSRRCTSRPSCPRSSRSTSPG